MLHAQSKVGNREKESFSCKPGERCSMKQIGHVRRLQRVFRDFIFSWMIMSLSGRRHFGDCGRMWGYKMASCIAQIVKKVVSEKQRQG